MSRIEDQPAPEPGEEPVWAIVIDDMAARDHTGTERYGTPLMTFNGRDALTDAYQEALDLVVYMRQAIAEDEARDRIAAKAQEEGLDLRTVDHIAEALLNAYNHHKPDDPSPDLRLSDYQEVWVRKLRIWAITTITDLDDDEAAEKLDRILAAGVESPA